MIRKTADENRATTSLLCQRRPYGVLRATVRLSVHQSRTERLDSSCTVAPGHRTWRINLSLHYLSHCVNKKSDIVFRRFRQHAVTESANPPCGRIPNHLCEIAPQMFLQVCARD